MPTGGKPKPPRQRAGTYKRPSNGLPRGTDFQATRGGRGRGVWKSPSGKVLGTSKSEDSPIRKTTQRKGKAV